MTTLALIVCLLSYILLLVLTGLRPKQPAISRYELQRRLKAGEPQAKKQQVKLAAINEVLSLVRLFKAILAVIFTYLIVDGYGWLAGGSLAVVGLMLLEVVARLKLVSQASRPLQAWLEQQLFEAAHLYGKHFRFLRGFEVWIPSDLKPSSPQELDHAIEHSQFLSSSEQQHLQAALKLDSVTAKSIIKPIKDQPTVSQNDLMGPLLLHELHQTGEDIFAVTASTTSSKIVGIIAISQLLSLDDKTSHKVKYYMNSDFPSFKLETPIRQCLNELVAAKAFMGVVSDSDNQVQGLVTLEACLQTTFGQSE